MYRSGWVVGCLLAAMATAGCTPTVKQKAPDSAIVSLSQAAESIHRDISLLAELRQQQVSLTDQVKAYETPISGSLAEPLTLSWSGPIEPALETIAEMIGYTFKVVGREPAQPILVTLNAQGRPAFEVVADLGWQAGEKVGVVLNQDRQELQVIYVGSES